MVPKIKRPMKAPTELLEDTQLGTIRYPLVGSPKLDGMRCEITDRVLSSSLKEINNRFVQKMLSGRPTLHGLDGELVVGSPFATHPEDDVFHRTSGPLRRSEGEPDFRLYVFDRFIDKDETYKRRWIDVMKTMQTVDPRVIVLEQRLLYNSVDLLVYEEEMLKAGYEGIMVRSLYAPYKEGRSTFKEGYIFKRKPFVDAEALIIGFVEARQNNNEAVTDELGRSKRSKHQENLVGKDTLGSFILKSKLWKDLFTCGGGIGLNDALRKEVWNNQSKYLGKVVTFKYQKYGSRDAPRIPGFKAFRWDIDLTKEEV